MSSVSFLSCPLRRAVFFVLLLTSSLCGRVLSAEAAPGTSPQAAFDHALVAYRAGALDQARSEFLEIVGGGGLSADLAHNLGNIEFRRGEHGQAVLWYKRALAMRPLSAETLQNLRAVRRQTPFLSFDHLGVSLSHLKLEPLRKTLAISTWALVLLIVWLIWLTPRRGRRWPLVTLLCLTLPVRGAATKLVLKAEQDPHALTSRQVVSGKETHAYSAPAEASATIIQLPPGSEVVPVETRGNWVYCIIPGGEGNRTIRGWVRSSLLEPLWPWKAPV